MQVGGRRVLVTGASRGIGAATARAFAAAGADVVVVARSEGPLKEIAAEIGGTAITADLGDPAAVAGLIDRVEREVGPVDVLVNNAASEAVGWFAGTPAEETEAVYRLNL